MLLTSRVKKPFWHRLKHAQGIEEKADEEIEGYQLRAQQMEAQMEKDAQAQVNLSKSLGLHIPWLFSAEQTWWNKQILWQIINVKQYASQYK